MLALMTCNIYTEIRDATPNDVRDIMVLMGSIINCAFTQAHRVTSRSKVNV